MPFFFLFLSLAPRVLTSTTCHDPLKIYLRLCFHIIMPSSHKKCFSYLVDFISQCGCTTDKQPVFTPFTDKQILQKNKRFQKQPRGKNNRPNSPLWLKILSNPTYVNLRSYWINLVPRLVESIESNEWKVLENFHSNLPSKFLFKNSTAGASTVKLTIIPFTKQSSFIGAKTIISCS